jgi:hypothetical protein
MVRNHPHHILLAQVLAGEDLVIEGHLIYHFVHLPNLRGRNPLEVSRIVLRQHFQADKGHLRVGLIASETTKEMPKILGKVF